MSASQIRAVLDEIELANIKIHGYGAANFARNLAQCYQKLAEREMRDQDLRTVMSFAERILECPMEIMDGVPETLAYLAERHELTLFTKGHVEEQKMKIDSSGLGVYFSHTAIVQEKDAEAYGSLALERMTPSEGVLAVWPVSVSSPKRNVGSSSASFPRPKSSFSFSACVLGSMARAITGS